jgi:hypothetical protein
VPKTVGKTTCSLEHGFRPRAIQLAALAAFLIRQRALLVGVMLELSGSKCVVFEDLYSSGHSADLIQTLATLD